MQRTIRNATIACLATIVSATSGQENGLTVPGGYRATYESISTPRSGIVNCIEKDTRGFMWFGTTRGLCRYDGYQMRRIPASTAVEEVVLAMMRTEDGPLLLGTAGGLVEFDPLNELFKVPSGAGQLTGVRINALAPAGDSAFWVGTGDRGLYRYEPRAGVLHSVGLSAHPDDSGIACLWVDRHRVLWIGTLTGGLFRLDPGMPTGAIVRRLAYGPVVSLADGAPGELWIGSTEGVEIMHTATGSSNPIVLPSRLQHTVAALAYDRGKSGVNRPPAMWMAVSDLGILLVSAGRTVTPLTSGGDSRSLGSVRSIFLDTAAAYGSTYQAWIGSRHGASRVTLRRNVYANHIRMRRGLELNRGAVLSFCEDRAGILWVGLWGGGLQGLRRTTDGYRRVHDLLREDDIYSICEDLEGRMWLGRRNGLAVLDRTRTRVTEYRPVPDDSSSIISDDIARLVMDSSGTIWVCTGQGLSSIEPGETPRFKRFLEDPEENHPDMGLHVSDVVQDRRGTIWVMTYGRGVNRMNPDGSFTRYLNPGDSSGTRENRIYNAHVDSTGAIYLSTSGGIVKFDPSSGRFETIYVEELHEVHVFGILAEPAGTLLLSTGIGLVRLDPRTRVLRRFGEDQGLAFREFFSDFSVNRRGEFMVGGADGFAEFDPKDLSTSGAPPPVAITGFKVFDRELPASDWTGGRLRLAYDENFVSVTFAALDMLHPPGNRFAYRMVGLDDHWIDAGTRNFASFTHLDPGEYLLQVKGSNSENVWNETGASLAITIVPPYWSAWWFRALVVAAFGAGLYGVYRYRLKSALAVERLRLRIADDLHDDIGSNLSSIAMASRVVERAPELSDGTRRRLREIYETAVTTSAGMKDIVWFIKPTSETADDLLLRMKDAAASLAAGIDLRFDAPSPGPATKLSVDFKRNYFLAFKEALTNVSRHARATRVEIAVAFSDGTIETTVRDDGVGFDPARTAGEVRGNGLASLRRRAASLGGTCEVVSEPGRGTTVRFTGRL